MKITYPSGEVSVTAPLYYRRRWIFFKDLSKIEVVYHLENCPRELRNMAYRHLTENVLRILDKLLAKHLVEPHMHLHLPELQT